nr:hypothetical protein [Tanacetum cinerariifolium]
MPPPFLNPEEDERVEETLTDLKLSEFTIKVPPPLIQKPKPPSQRNYVAHQSWGGSIRPEGFLSSILLWLVIIVAIVGGGVTIVVVVESSFVVKLSFGIT